jgi:hypothetical protein
MAEDRRVVAESSRLLLALADSNSAAGLRLIDACCIFLIQYSHARLMPCIPRLHASTQLEGHARVGRMLWMRSGGRSRTLDFPFVFLVFFGHLHGVFGEGVDAWCEQWSEPGGEHMCICAHRIQSAAWAGWNVHGKGAAIERQLGVQ